jgi:hypothetical protein
MPIISIIISIPPTLAPIYERVGQPLPRIGAGFVMVVGDQIDYVIAFVRIHLTEPESMKGVWVSIPSACVAAVVSADRCVPLGFAQA